MTKRTILASFLTLLALALAYGVMGTYGGISARLRSGHSEPPLSIPARQVAVTPEGKLFHDPSCTYIHGRVEMMSAEEAARAGYTPCTRCMHEALRLKGSNHTSTEDASFWQPDVPLR